MQGWLLLEQGKLLQLDGIWLQMKKYKNIEQGVNLKKLKRVRLLGLKPIGEHTHENN